MTIVSDTFEGSWLKSGVLLTLSVTGQLIANIPSGQPGPSHPHGTYAQAIPITEDGLRVVLRILQEQHRLAGRRPRAGDAAAPTVSQINEWLRQHGATKVQVGRPSNSEPYPKAGSTTYEDLFG